MNDKIKDVSFIFPKGTLEDDWREEALRHREEILQLKVQLQQKENIIKEVREYIENYETIRGYYEYEEDGYDEYNYEEDLKQELLEILEKEVN